MTFNKMKNVAIGAALLASVVAMPEAEATIISQSLDYASNTSGEGRTTYSENRLVELFDPSLGTLNSVSISGTVSRTNFSGFVGNTSFFIVPITGDLTVRAQVTFRFTDLFLSDSLVHDHSDNEAPITLSPGETQEINFSDLFFDYGWDNLITDSFIGNGSTNISLGAFTSLGDEVAPSLRFLNRDSSLVVDIGFSGNLIYDYTAFPVSVPAPPSLALMLLGLTGMGFYRRRKTRY